MVRIGASAPLAGRREELEFTLGLLGSKTTRALVLAGCAGVGKTRLAIEVAATARSRGMHVAWANATRATADVPLGAITHLLLDLATGPPGTDPVGTELLGRTGAALRDLARGRGLVLVIDDAQHLDEVTGALVLQLLSQPDIFVVVTVRSGEPVPDTVLRLWKDGLADRFDVQLLAQADVESMVTTLVGGRVEAHTQYRIWDLTRGNPLFVRELVLDGLEAGTLRDAGGVWTWEGPLRTGAHLEEVVEARIAGVSPAQRELLEILAIGEPLSFDVLARVVDIKLVPDLERRGVVRVDEQRSLPVLLLSHPVYAEVLRATMPVTTRWALMGRLADAIETRSAGADDMLRVAMWRLESGAAVKPDVLVAAATRANALRDRPLAERLAQAALRAGPSSVATIELAEAFNARLRFDEAAELLQPLVERPPLDMADSDRVRLATELQECLFWGKGDVGDSTAMLTRLIDQVCDQAAAQYIEALQATAMYFSGANDDAARVALRFVHDDTIDPIARLRAIPAIGAVALQGRALEALGLAEQMAELVVVHIKQCPNAVVWLPSVRGASLFLLGRIDEAEQLARTFHDLSVARGDENTGSAATSLGVLAITRGLPETALVWLREALVLLRQHDPNLSRPWALGAAAWAEAMLGHVDAATAFLAEADASYRPAIALHSGYLELARAWVQLRRDDPAGAVTTVLEAAAAAGERGQLAARLMMLHEALRLGGRDGLDVAIEQTAARVEGELAAAYSAHARALRDDDGAALERSAASFDAMGLWLLAAEVSAEAASAYRRAGQASRAHAAAARSARAAQRCEGARSPALASALEPIELTRRQREIAGLAAKGMSNAEIARHLTVSVRTVEGHLYNAFGKLGVSDRAALVELLG